jgi:ribosomal protein L37E/mannose-6-phosphate isomerase-like protein (cupin superfamily)
MENFNPNNIVTKDFPTSTINHANELSIAEKNAKFTRLVWRTHNDFHNHKFWEICLVLKGKGKHYFTTHTDDMYAGTMWLLRPNDVHKIQPLPQSTSRDTPYAHRDIYIEEKGGKELVLFDTPNSEFMHTKILELCGEKTKKDEFYENHIDCDHCGSYYDNKSSKCPNCGAPKESKANKK